jgi:mRNA interferase MazF
MIDAEPRADKEYGEHDAESGNIRRPMVVLSSDDYNENSDMCVGMMITSTKRPLSVQQHKEFIDVASGIHGKIIMWQIPNYDYRARHMKIVGHIHGSLLKELVQRAKDIFE